jgi:GT2 family glycosyltransferase/glycosyltransferase involved in cell wall biosynthesis
MSPLRRTKRRIADLAHFRLLRSIGTVTHAPGLRAFHRALVTRVLEKSKLFDAEFYVSHNVDVAVGLDEALQHYVAEGDRDGRWPMPLFDPVYYARHAGIERATNVNRLLHYALIGRYRRISPSPWFDASYYLAQNKDVARSGLDPLLHFVRWGGSERRSPSPRFDSDYYLRANPDVAQHGANPLLHYLSHGQYEGRLPLPTTASTTWQAWAQDVPDPDQWHDVAHAGGTKAARVDVVVPVYRGAVLTLRCLYSVLHAVQKTPFELIVVDDASPEHELAEVLERLASRGLFTLLRNEENRGFVCTANRGMRLHPDRDVILLNADAEVYGDWLDRLRAATSEDPRVATVTPLSNNATICSYPSFNQDNPYPLELTYAELDELAQEANRGARVPVPTAVGFCMYIRRQCLSEIGYFDEEAFGRGYGEENDFCQRAIAKGWSNIVAGDVFVRHWGAASFQGERAALVSAAMETLGKRHPRYHKDVAAFVREDPLAPVRERLDRARLRREAHGDNVLIVSHHRGGGTERHVAEEVDRLIGSGHGVFLMRPAGAGERVTVGHPDIKDLPNLGTFSLRESAPLEDLLEWLAIAQIHVHQLIDYHRKAPDWIGRLASRIGATLRVVTHDYAAICPRINLVGESGLYCGEPAEAVCTACLAKKRADSGRIQISAWRERYGRLLRQAQEVVVPDADVAQRLARYVPDASYSVRPHEPPESFARRFLYPELAPEERLRVVVIGAIGRIKGYDVLSACAADAMRRQLPIDFVVYGYTLNDARLRQLGVTITGRYFDEYADEGLAALEPHAIWLPYVWPETYSYTLSLALRCRRPIFAFRIGAVASRLEQLGLDRHLVPLARARRPTRINDAFVAFRARVGELPVAMLGPVVARSLQGQGRAAADSRQ